jgi:hypothetical protein
MVAAISAAAACLCVIVCYMKKRYLTLTVSLSDTHWPPLIRPHCVCFFLRVCESGNSLLNSDGTSNQPYLQALTV